MKQGYWLVFFWVVLIIIGSCARRGTPTGGPKDSIPPTLVQMTPELETVNFNDKEIELEFNEYIEARELKEELIITPPIADYDFYVNRRIIHLEIEDELRDSTTYTFNFRNAIKDISERNPAQNIVVAFSTGPEIDSFQVTGTIRNLLTQQPVEDAVVSLYDVNDTLDVFTGPPMYLAKTDEEGNYTIRYIREGLYNIYAYLDENNNLKVDSNNEPFGFKVEPIYLGATINQQLIQADSLLQIDTTNTQHQTVNLAIRREDIRPIVLQSARPNGQYFEIRFNKPLMDYTLRPASEVSAATQEFLEDSVAFNLADTTRVLFSNFQDQHRIIRVYNTLRQDSLQVQLLATDSAQQVLSDTLFYIKFAETRRQAADFTSQFQAEEDKITTTLGGTFTFSKPVAQIYTDSILLSYDTLFYVPIDYSEALEWNKHLDQLTLSVPVHRQQIVDSVLYYSRINDSLMNETRVEQQQLFLDSLQSAAPIEKRLDWVQQFAQHKGGGETSRIIDSLQTLESEEEKNTLLNAYTDTVQITRQFPLKDYDREEIANTLQSFNFYAAPGSFMSIENDSSEQVLQKFSFKSAEDYGSIRGTVVSEYPSYIIQLLDQRFNVVRERKNSKSFSFDMVEPGKYQIRILVDADNDGIWEEGSILKNEEPEPVYFYAEEELIDLRANWERSDLTITIGELSTLSSE